MSDEGDTVPVQIAMSRTQLDSIDRFQRDQGLFSRDKALRFLLDIALEAVTGTGRRFWDKPLISSQPGGDTFDAARALGDRLRAEGHHEAAERLHHATAGARGGDAIAAALLEACELALTTIEALDPKTAMMAEGLRATLEQRLSR